MFEDEEYLNNKYSYWAIQDEKPINIFRSNIQSIKEIIAVSNLSDGAASRLKLMALIYLISSLESYLSSAIIEAVMFDRTSLRRLINSDPELKNRSLPITKICESNHALENCVLEHLDTILFHNLKKIKPMFKSTLEFDMGDISWLFKAIKLRHDVAHNGGESIFNHGDSIPTEELNETISKSLELAELINTHIHENVIAPLAYF